MKLNLTVDDFQADLNTYRNAGMVTAAIYDDLFELMDSLSPMPTEHEVDLMHFTLDEAFDAGRIHEDAHERLCYLASNWLS